MSQGHTPSPSLVGRSHAITRSTESAGASRRKGSGTGLTRRGSCRGSGRRATLWGALSDPQHHHDGLSNTRSSRVQNPTKPQKGLRPKWGQTKSDSISASFGGMGTHSSQLPNSLDGRDIGAFTWCRPSKLKQRSNRGSMLLSLGRADGPRPRLLPGAPVTTHDGLHRLLKQVHEPRVTPEIDAGSPRPGILSVSPRDDRSPRAAPAGGRLCRRPSAAHDRFALCVDEGPRSRDGAIRRAGNCGPCSHQRETATGRRAPTSRPIGLYTTGRVPTRDRLRARYVDRKEQKRQKGKWFPEHEMGVRHQKRDPSRLPTRRDPDDRTIAALDTAQDAYHEALVVVRRRAPSPRQRTPRDSWRHIGR